MRFKPLNIRIATYYFFSMQYTIQRVYSKRDLFKTVISMDIARDHHNRIVHRFIEL